MKATLGEKATSIFPLVDVRRSCCFFPPQGLFLVRKTTSSTELELLSM